MLAFKATITHFCPNLAFFVKISAWTEDHISARRKFFSIKLTYDCSSVLNDKIPGEKRHLSSKTVVPQQFCQKNSSSWAKTALFLLFWLERHRYWDEVSFLLGELIIQRRTTNTSGVFWKMSDRPRYRGLISELQSNADEKLGCGLAKKGAENCPPKILHTLFGLNI